MYTYNIKNKKPINLCNITLFKHISDLYDSKMGWGSWEKGDMVWFRVINNERWWKKWNTGTRRKKKDSCKYIYEDIMGIWTMSSPSQGPELSTDKMAPPSSFVLFYILFQWTDLALILQLRTRAVTLMPSSPTHFPPYVDYLVHISKT